ncbi:hypothetical protein NKH18_26650 [Streptomyces sp. M10(2022)]
MTRCIKGLHDFPIEDESGAYCDEHGVTLLWHSDPISEQDLDPGHPLRRERPELPPA